MILQLETTKVFKKNYEATKKIIANQGGTRSSKTYSILQVLIVDAINQKTESITTIARKELSTLRVTAMRDFLEILKDNNIYREQNHNKSEQTYQLGKVLFEFAGLDSPTKKRGAKRRRLFVNEANEITLEDWRQLILRTTDKIFIDYNPSDEFHWIYDFVLTRDDCEYIHSTYKDNGFLEQSIIEEIERLQFEDENFWRIYGLGERGISSERIYNNWDIVNEFPQYFNETTYGLDFGFNHPTALVEVNENENDIYLRELIYKNGLLNIDIIKLMTELIPNRNKYVYADSANPDKIEEIYQAGFNVYPADKSVKDGIDYVKRKKLHIHKDSVNLIKEIKSYSWKVDKLGRILDEPVKYNDDLCFAAGTQITTINGQKNIEDVLIGDLVLTSNGYKKVSNSMCNGYKKIFEYLIETDYIAIKIKCTANHKIKTEKSWKCISELNAMDSVFLAPTSMENVTSYMLEESISPVTNGVCTGTFGNIITEKFLKDFKFITKIRTLQTIFLRTLNLLKASTTLVNMEKKTLKQILKSIKEIWQRQQKPQKYGMEVKRVESGTPSIGGIIWQNSLSQLRKSVNVVENLLMMYPHINKLNFVAMPVNHSHEGIQNKIMLQKNVSFAQKNSVPINTVNKDFAQRAVVLSIAGKEEGLQKVYDLTVENEHEYFANGLLVHNCDAVRYALYREDVGFKISFV